MRNARRWLLAAAVAGSIAAVAPAAPAGAFAGFSPALVSGAPGVVGNGASTLPQGFGLVADFTNPLGSTRTPVDQIYGRAVSDDGRYVTYVSAASNLAGGGQGLFSNDGNGATDVFLLDRQGERLLVSGAGAGGGFARTANGASSDPVISGDGRYVVFRSAASDLVPNDTNPGVDVFVRESFTGRTALITRNAAGAPAGNNALAQYVLSRDGSTVVVATGVPMDARDTNGMVDVYAVTVSTALAGVHAPELLSVNLAGGVSTGPSITPSVSDDGRHVAFRTGVVTDEIVGIPDGQCPGQSSHPGCGDVVVRHRDSQTTELVSINAAGTRSGNGISQMPRISGNGRYVLFHTLSNQDLLGPSDGRYSGSGYWVRDLLTDTTRLASRHSGPNLQDDGNAFILPRHGISRDGRFSVWETKDPNFVAGDTADVDIALYDWSTDTPRLITVTSTGASANGDSRGPSISDDGRTVTFTSTATAIGNLTFPNATPRIFAYDTATGAIAQLDRPAPFVQGTAGPSAFSMPSADGNTVVFQSASSNLVSNDTNGATDVFVVPISRATRGIAPTLATGAGGRTVAVTGHLACFAPHASIGVTITQGGTTATGTAQLHCETSASEATWTSTASTRGSGRLEPGPATGCAVAELRRRGETVQVVEWCREVVLT